MVCAHTVKRALFVIICLLASLASTRAGEWSSETAGNISSTPVLVGGKCDLNAVRELINADPTQIVYLHFYNAASAGDVTVGTTHPLLTLGVAAGPGHLPLPITGQVIDNFTLGLVIAATTSPLYSGTTAPNTPLVVFLTFTARQ
jgi:hypothetical protein